MSRRRPVRLGVAAVASVVIVPLLAGQALAQEVGTAAAVNPAVQARGQGGARTVIIGQSIAHRERIQTTSAGSVQLVFLDKTSMTVGPNSDIAIDEYVYDPATNTGKLAATLTKGVMRFVGGQVSHTGNAQIRTPTSVVGIRGGVGIFQGNNIYVGFGQAQVTSGSSSVTLEAGEFTQTARGVPPTTPGPPPEGFLAAVLASLQSQAGQGGGARATAAQVNRARRLASGSDRGNIATDVYALLRSIDLPDIWWIRPTIVTANTSRSLLQDDAFPGQIGTLPTTPDPNVPTPPPSGSGGGTLVGFTGGLIHSIGQNGAIGQSFGAVGTTVVQIDPSRNRSQANLSIVALSRESQNALQFGAVQFGSLDPNLASGNITINELDGLIGTASALAPTKNANNVPISTVNGTQLTQHNGVFVEIRPGSTLSNALSSRVGQRFCQCEHTQWGLWDSQFIRPGPNNSTIEERAQMFWVAGRLPSAGDVPTHGFATYDGHAIAAIRNGSQTYVAAGAFQNNVNFGTRTGSISVTGLDSTNYAGRMRFTSDPRFFTGSLSSLNNQGRSLALSGSFFTGSTSPVGEMGGALAVTGSSYTGSGIFAGRMR